MKPATGNLKSAMAQISLSRIGEHAEKCELTNQSLNTHSRNRYYRQDTGDDVVFLWRQLLVKTFSFKSICKFHGSDLKGVGTDWVLSKPSLWPKFTISQLCIDICINIYIL